MGSHEQHTSRSTPASHDVPADEPSNDADENRSGLSIDEQFRALLEGLRTSLPAVQVLFAFLLTAPFQSGFDDLNSDERAAFAIAFYTSGAASVLLIAPSVHQRVRAPFSGLERRSLRHLVWATWLAILGSIATVIAIVATVYLVTTVVFGATSAGVAAAVGAGIVAWSWFYLPLVTFRRGVSSNQSD